MRRTREKRAWGGHYRDLFKDAADAIFVRDLEGYIREVNQAASDLTGYAVDELTKMNISQIFTPGSLETAMKRQHQQLEGRVVRQRYEMELVRKDGSRRIVEAITRLITDGGSPVGVQGMLRDVTEERRLRESMQFYIGKITAAQEEERKRIARELHDDTAQSLAALLLDIEAMRKARDQLSEDTLLRLEKLRTAVCNILEGVRRFSHELRPGVLDQLGLVSALELLTDELSEQGQVKANLEIVGYERRLSPDVELALFRIAQAALCNVRKHSAATEVVVRVEYDTGKVKLDVIDNGKGFELPASLGDLASRGKLGLLGMQERARLLDGSFEVRSGVGKGTTIAVEAIV